MMKRRSLLFFVALSIVACSAPNGSAPIGSPSVANAGVAAPSDFSLHPPSIHFSSPSERYKVEHVRGFGENGSIAENCIQKGVAEVAGDGLHGNTLVADVIPRAPGRCEATFTNGSGAKLRLPVTVSR
jgi:hypothetical protein